MTAGGTRARIVDRAGFAGVVLADSAAERLEVYLELLGRWNKKINLTALSLDPLADLAIDRLIVEPLLAARQVLPDDRLLVDLGSGGGSPAVPFGIAVPALRLVMVESRERKSAFLREVVRQLGLTGAEIVTARYETLAGRADLNGSADVVSVRAVRADVSLWEAVRGLLKPDGRLFWFTTSTASENTVNWPFNQINKTRISLSDATPGSDCLVVASPKHS